MTKIRIARRRPEKIFLLTAVGTGIAGIDISMIKELFKNLPTNVRKVGW